MIELKFIKLVLWYNKNEIQLQENTRINVWHIYNTYIEKIVCLRPERR